MDQTYRAKCRIEISLCFDPGERVVYYPLSILSINTTSKIGAWIRENRKKKNFNQNELADRLSVFQPQVSDWENGKTSPSKEMIQKISVILGAEVDERTFGIGLGEWLKRKRNELGWSQARLAKEANVSQLAISFIETGKTESPQQSTIKSLEDALGRMPHNLNKEVQEERTIENMEFLGPFPIEEWESNLTEDRVSCIYVFYDQLKRPVRIGETDNLRRRMKEYQQYFWFRSPVVETFAYVVVNDPESRRKTEKVMIKLVGEHAIFNIQDKI